MERKLSRMPGLEAVLVPHTTDHGRVLGPAERRALARPASLRLVLFELWVAAATEEEDFAERLWAELTVSGELDAEIFRWRAIRQAARQARRLGLQATPRDRWLAETEIAYAHGFYSWAELRQAFSTSPLPASEWTAYRDELALAKRFRDSLFNPAPAHSCGSE
jgi:hypothetical protein